MMFNIYFDSVPLQLKWIAINLIKYRRYADI